MPVTDARRELISVKFRTEINEDTAVKTAHKRARELEIDSPLDVLADAASLASGTLTLFKELRHNYQVEVIGQQFKRKLGETITLKFSDLGLDGTKDAIVRGIKEDADKKTTTLDLFI